MLFSKRRRQLKSLVINNMDVLYAVPWIDVEYGWGSKPDGFKIFDDLEECIKSTNESSEKGNYEGGYLGPERPLIYYEIPKNSVDNSNIESGVSFFIDELKFKSTSKPINKSSYDKSR